MVAPVIDFVLKALEGHGEIVVGDAPMQECNFEKLIAESHFKELIEFYKSKTSVKVSLIDFRDLHSYLRHGMNYSYLNAKTSGILVNLGKESEFNGADEYYFDHLRITNYDPAILKTHHNAEMHEYYVNQNILHADVIINMPKPKTHRKAGVTIALKNLVGMSARKEYLPHHTNGSKKEGGDEYLYSSLLKRMKDKMLDKRNYYMQTKKAYLRAWELQQIIRALNLFIRITAKDHYVEGNWYGNDTISKTIIDLNKILFYADKEGHLCKEKQRKYFIVADMIISGEKEGPIMPSAKNVGIIAMGFNPVCFDEAIATLMGAKPDSIPTLSRARNIKSINQLVGNERPFLISNDVRWNQKNIEDLTEKDKLYFQPSEGWKEVFFGAWDNKI